MKSWGLRLIRLTGADSDASLRLASVYRKEFDFRLDSQVADGGLDRQAMQAFIGIYLGMISLGLVSLAFILKDRPSVYSFSVFLVVSASVLLYFVFGMFTELAGEEDFKITSIWPISSQTFLVSKLLGPGRSALQMTFILAAPTSIAACFTIGTPILSGITVFLLCCLVAISLVAWVGCFFPLLLALFGLQNMRMSVFFVFSSLFLITIIFGDDLSAVGLKIFELPMWCPLSWLAGLVSMTTGNFEHFPSILMGSLLFYIVLPMLIFRLTAQFYRRGMVLGVARSHTRKSSGFFNCFGFFMRKPEDRILFKLVQAHARGDWRFRLQALLILVLLLAFILAETHGEKGFDLFRNPMEITKFIHPSMFMMLLIMLPPLLALPLLSSSSDFKAAWILKIGIISESRFQSSVVRLVRGFFTIPISLVFLGFYLFRQTELLPVVGHLLVLGLLAELVTHVVQLFWKGIPFSLDSRDQDIMNNAMPLFMMFETLSFLLAVFLFHVVYRWWWAYMLFLVVSFFFMRQLKLEAKSKPEDKNKIEDQGRLKEGLSKKKPIKQMDSPLLTALKHGHLQTAKVLIQAGTNRDVLDTEGQSALDIACSKGFDEIAELLQK